MLTVLLNILFLTCAVQSENLIRELVRKDISNERRDAVVEQLKQSDISETAPMILNLINDYASPTEPGIWDKPWMSDHHSHRAKVWYASHAIWQEWFKGREDPVKAAILVRLLRNDNGYYSLGVILNTMRFHWATEAEQPVFGLFLRGETSELPRYHAIQVLLERYEERYVIHTIEFIRSSDPRSRPDLFHLVSERFFSYSDVIREKLIALGFSILENNEGPGGYFVARALGRFLKIPGEFAPDQNSHQYRGENGLKEQFFSGAVRNALEWKRNNEKAGDKNQSSKR